MLLRSVCPRVLLLICRPKEIPLWPEGQVPIPEENAAAKLPGPEKVEDRAAEGYDNRWITGTQHADADYHPARRSEKRSGAAVVVCPGGGYAGLAFDKEGLSVGRWLAERGIVAVTLKYRYGGGAHEHPVPLMDVTRAMRTVRAQAAEWHIDADRIGVMGFSAGGHLASCAATMHEEGDSSAADAIARQSSRPDFAILVYPVISMELKVTHAGSRRHLLGSRRDKELIAQMSTYNRVDEQTPPTILFHAADDSAVPIENSLRFYRALLEHKVPAELHAYEEGGHGFGMLKRGLPGRRLAAGAGKLAAAA